MEMRREGMISLFLCMSTQNKTKLETEYVATLSIQKLLIWIDQNTLKQVGITCNKLFLVLKKSVKYYFFNTSRYEVMTGNRAFHKIDNNP